METFGGNVWSEICCRNLVGEIGGFFLEEIPYLISLNRGGAPLSVNFCLLKIGLKTVFYGQKMLFLAENLLNFVRYGGGGGPPHSVNFFPLVFRKNSVRYGGGGVPPLSVNFFR